MQRPGLGVHAALLPRLGVELREEDRVAGDLDVAEHLTEQLNEDEWGDPDGNHDVLSDEGQALLTEKIAALLRKHRGYISPWACEVTKTVVLEADELVAMVRQQCPEWFEKPKPRPPFACSVCHTPIAKFIPEGMEWHACLKCAGAKCEKCCDAEASP